MAPRADLEQFAPAGAAAARQRQVAALCLRHTGAGPKVLLITSRGTGRWVLPKGWPIPGLDDSRAALQEAWEEAGVRRADVLPVPIGSYDYDKVLKDGDTAPVVTRVYLARVSELAKHYPECKQRQRHWFSPEEAAERVAEPQLRAILRRI